jgi:hypothetical protein
MGVSTMGGAIEVLSAQFLDAHRVQERALGPEQGHDGIVFDQPVAVLAEHRGHPHRIVHRQPDESAEQQVVLGLFHQLPLGAYGMF